MPGHGAQKATRRLVLQQGGAQAHTCKFEKDYSGFMRCSIPTNEPRRTTMMRFFPMTLAALQLGLASAATYLLCATDTLAGMAVGLIH